VVENTWQQPLGGATWPLTTAETNVSAKPNSPQITQIQTMLSDTGQVSKQTFAYDRYTNQTDVYEYDYGAATPLRRTHTDYVTTNTVGGMTYDYACSPSTTCSNATINKDVIHQRSLPKQVSIYDAAGVEQLRTTYEYDNYATDTNHAQLVDRFSITGLCTTYDAAGTCSNTNPPAYITRGNVTGTTKYLLTNGTITGSVSTYQQCDVAGNAVKSIDARGKTSTLDYADSFCNGSTCGGTYNSYTYAFATSAASPVPDSAGMYGSATALTTSTIYDFWSGLTYSTTDVNNNTTTLSYADALGNLDPLDRLKSVTRPDGGKTDFNYGDTVGNLYVQTLADLDATRRTEARQYFDGFGRSIRSFTWENQDAAKP
jgi:hypothetical protein